MTRDQAKHTWACEDCDLTTEDIEVASEHRRIFTGHTIHKIRKQTGLNQQWSS